MLPAFPAICPARNLSDWIRGLEPEDLMGPPGSPLSRQPGSNSEAQA